MNKDVMGVQEVSPGYEFVAENPAVPVGYKQTEVGVIPGGWDVSTISDLASVTSGATPPRSLGERYFQRGTIPWVKTLDLNNSVIKTTDEAVTEHALRETSIRLNPAGTVLVAMYGGYAQIGRTGYLMYPATTNQALSAIIPESKKLDSKYLLYVLNYRVEHWKSVASSSRKDPNITGNDVRAFTLPLPPVVEQRAIATALIDVDALLEELDRLIAKKRDIKQAAMQQLLTGETRLPGFDGEWESFRLGDHVTFLKTGTNSRAELQSDGNDASVRYLHYGDIHASKASFMDSSALPFLPSEKAATLGRLQNGDLIMSDASEDIEGIGKSVEITNVGTADVVAGLHTIAARFSPDVLADGFKAYLQYCPAFITPLRRLAAGTKVYATTRKHVGSIEMQLPGLEEQVAIAHVFKDMDTEIQALEQRRSKTAELKQGMMQELLTGRTRLV